MLYDVFLLFLRRLRVNEWCTALAAGFRVRRPGTAGAATCRRSTVTLHGTVEAVWAAGCALMARIFHHQAWLGNGVRKQARRTRLRGGLVLSARSARSRSCCTRQDLFRQRGDEVIKGAPVSLTACRSAAAYPVGVKSGSDGGGKHEPATQRACLEGKIAAGTAMAAAARLRSAGVPLDQPAHEPEPGHDAGNLPHMRSSRPPESISPRRVTLQRAFSTGRAARSPTPAWPKGNGRLPGTVCFTTRTCFAAWRVTALFKDPAVASTRRLRCRRLPSASRVHCR